MVIRLTYVVVLGQSFSPYLSTIQTISDKFYEFTLGMTVLSFLVTLVLSALSRVNRTLPPSHRLVLFASAVNTYLCCTEVDAEEKTTGSGNNKGDWRQVFELVNNLVSLVLMFAYVIGVLCLCL